MSTGENLSDSEATETTQWDSLTDYESQPEEPLTPEQKKSELTFEKVSELSTDEYIELWRRLNPFYATHATRQGIRDHSGMVYHSAGLGAFSNGMKAMLRDGKTLRTKAGANYGLMPGFTEEDVARALDTMIGEESEMFTDLTPEETVGILPMNATFASAEPWSDQQAVHFGQLTVLDDFYGAETGNEAFCVFPTDVIASQCQFGGHMYSLTMAQVRAERKWNDLFVWPKDGKIPLDAGFVFLPSSQMVDRKTGSRYSIQEQVTETGEIVFTPAKDEERIKRFKEWIESLTEDSPEVVAVRQGGDNSLMKQKVREIGIPERCINSLVSYGHEYTILMFVGEGHLGNLYLPQEQLERMTPEEKADYSIRLYLESNNADLKEAEDTIPAREYWEQYFADHPEEKPKHIIYYDGDPSTAVEEFLTEHGIAKQKEPRYISPYSYSSPDREQAITGPGDSSERDGKMLGFDDHYVRDPGTNEEMRAEHVRFNQLALKILRERQKASEQK